jgi:hypothetical protein
MSSVLQVRRMYGTDLVRICGSNVVQIRIADTRTPPLVSLKYTTTSTSIEDHSGR